MSTETNISSNMKGTLLITTLAYLFILGMLFSLICIILQKIGVIEEIERRLK